MKIRDADRGDLPGILEIFNDVVANTTAVWFDAVDDLAGRERWFDGRQARGFPVLVAVANDEVLGYCSYGDFRAWDGYRHTVEHSIYMKSNHRRTGLGHVLLSALIEKACESRLHAMIGAIEAGNTASIALHRKLGFQEVARMPEVGCKFGRWLDLALMQLQLDSRQTP